MHSQFTVKVETIFSTNPEDSPRRNVQTLRAFNKQHALLLSQALLAASANFSGEPVILTRATPCVTFNPSNYIQGTVTIPLDELEDFITDLMVLADKVKHSK